MDVICVLSLRSKGSCIVSRKETKKSSFQSTPLHDKESQEGSFFSAERTQAYNGPDRRIEHENAVIPGVITTEVEIIFSVMLGKVSNIGLTYVDIIFLYRTFCI